MNQTLSACQLEEAYNTCGTAVYRLAMVYLGRRADAEDVTQEVFLRLLCRAPTFADGEHRRRWLLQVTANLCRDQLRGFWRRRVTELEDSLPAAAPEEQTALDAVMALPEQYRLGPSISTTTRATRWQRWLKS